MAARTGALLQSGLLILAGLAVLGTGIYLVRGGREQFEPKARYTVVFADGGGISGGDKVYLDGQRVGIVLGTESIRRPGRDGRLLRVQAEIEIRRAAEIPVDSRLIVTKTITRVIALEITSGRSRELADGETELVGEQFKTFDEMKTDAQAFVDDFASVREHFGSLMDRIGAMAGDLDTATIRSNADAAFTALDRAFTKGRTLVDELSGPYEEVVAEFGRGADEWRGLRREIGGDWPRVQERFEEARAGLEAVAAEARDLAPGGGDLRAALGDALGRLDSAFVRVRAVGHAIEETSIEAKPQVKAIMRKASGLEDGFGSLRGDLVRAPWKLLNKPSPEEVDAVHRFNALRLYIEAANEVSRTADALDTLRRLDVLGDPRQAELVERLTRRLRRALAEFDARQRRVVELLGEAGNGK